MHMKVIHMFLKFIAVKMHNEEPYESEYDEDEDEDGAENE